MYNRLMMFEIFKITQLYMLILEYEVMDNYCVY